MTDDPLGPEEAQRLEHAGRTSAIIGVMAMACGMITCLALPAGMVALGAGIMAIWFSQEPRAAQIGGAGEAYANVGLWTGALAVGWSLLILLLFCLYIGLYVAMIGMAFGSAAIGL
jgi:hypothetical protein